MKVTILTDSDSWIQKYLHPLLEGVLEMGHELFPVSDREDIPEGDVVFCLGCSQFLPPRILLRNRNNLVVHESDLPRGRGWSPLTWQILEGKEEIVISLFEAAETVDSGRIYLQETVRFEGTELVSQLRRQQAESSIRLCLEFLRQYPGILVNGKEQTGEPSYYKRRSPEDSRLDIDKSLREQFNLLRVVDNDRYPAFFTCLGRTYKLLISEYNNGEER